MSDVLAAFDALVADYEMTCEALPTQYEGRLRDGRIFYFRYRDWTAALGIGATLEEACEYDGRASIGYEGSMDEPEFKDAFVMLYEVWCWQARREGRMSA